MSGYDIVRFLAEAEGVAMAGYSDAAVDSIAVLMGRLATETDVLNGHDLGGLHEGAAAAEILGRGDGGSVLMLGRFPAAAPTPVHNHNSWGVAYVLAGRDRYERWRRADDGADRERASLELVETVELGPGEAVGIPPPPQDVHAQQGIGDVVWELAFFAADPNREPRAYFDPEAGTVSYRGALG